MPSPISSRDASSGDFTPYHPEDDVCRAADEPAGPSAPPDDAADSSSARVDAALSHGSPVDHDPDYYAMSAGAGAIIGGGVSVTLDRHGHVYLGLAGGVGLSATVGSVGLMAGEMADGSDHRPSEDRLRSFLQGDSVGASAAMGFAAGVTNAAGGTATEVGVGMVQAEVHFQHTWHVADLPVRW